MRFHAIIPVWLILGAAQAHAVDTQHPFKLCVLDRTALLGQSKLAANEAAHFQQVRQAAQARFDQDSRALDADARTLDGLRANLPPAVAKARDEDIARRRIELKARGDQINRNLAQLDSELTTSVVKLAEPVIHTVEREQGCSMLIERSALLNLDDPGLDITPIVIQRINAPGPNHQGRSISP